MASFPKLSGARGCDDAITAGGGLTLAGQEANESQYISSLNSALDNLIAKLSKLPQQSRNGRPFRRHLKLGQHTGVVGLVMVSWDVDERQGYSTTRTG